MGAGRATASGPRVALDRLTAPREPDRGTHVIYAGGGPRTTTERPLVPSAEFGTAMAQREPFKPVSRDDFHKRFVDVPTHVHQAGCKEAFVRALSIATAATTQATSLSSSSQQDWQGG